MLVFHNNDDMFLETSTSVKPVDVFNKVYKIEYADYFKALALEAYDCSLLDHGYSYNSSIYLELYALQSKARNILFEYKRAKTHSVKNRLIEFYYSLCSQIKKIKKEIDKYKNNISVKPIYKIAASFKLLTSYVTLNLRFLYRTVIRFLFKNMDDNSGFDYFFQTVIEKNIYNQNYSSNGRTESIFRINMQNRRAFN